MAKEGLCEPPTWQNGVGWLRWGGSLGGGPPPVGWRSPPLGWRSYLLLSRHPQHPVGWFPARVGGAHGCSPVFKPESPHVPASWRLKSELWRPTHPPRIAVFDSGVGPVDIPVKGCFYKVGGPGGQSVQWRGWRCWSRAEGSLRWCSARMLVL